MESFLSRVRDRLEFLRLERRYARRTHRSGYHNSAQYVDGEYIASKENKAASSSSSTSTTTTTQHRQHGNSYGQGHGHGHGLTKKISERNIKVRVLGLSGGR